jgi:hypothetical protein
MFSDDLQFLNPGTPELETLELQQIAYDFRREVEHREAFEQHCQWYRDAAAYHQKELLQMQTEVNLFGWFCRLMWSR